MEVAEQRIVSDVSQGLFGMLGRRHEAVAGVLGFNGPLAYREAVLSSYREGVDGYDGPERARHARGVEHAVSCMKGRYRLPCYTWV